MTFGRAFDILRLRLRSIFRRSAVERDLRREIEFHLEQEQAEKASGGLSPEEAHFAAQRSIGGIAQIEEECRDMRRMNMIDNLRNDIRYALRTLRGSPGFTAVILLTLALSIGATTAIFSVIEGVLLRPLPFREPGQIVRVFFNSDVYAKFPLNPYDFRDFRSRNRTFSSMAAITRKDVQLSEAGEPVMLQSFNVTAGYFELLGFHPRLGREFNTRDELSSAPDIAVLSDRLWRARFAADPHIVGRRIILDAKAYTVVGVMPPGVQHPGNEYHSVADGETVDVWQTSPFGNHPEQRGSHFMEGIGRLKPGITSSQANADLTGVLNELMRAGNTGKKWRIFLVPLYTELVGKTQRMLYVLLAAVGLLLLVACVNAANLLLARATARQREMAVRISLGASRGRLIRQLLTESLLIAAGGALLGSGLAVASVRTLIALLPPGFPRASSIQLDPTLFAFTISIALLTGLLFGMVPALATSNTDPQQKLREGGRGSSAARGMARLRNALVAGETALACVLLIGAGLMLHSFANLLRSDPGFQPNHTVTAGISLSSVYKNPADNLRFYTRLISDLQRVPGSRAVGIGSDLPFTGWDENIGGFNVEGRSAEYSEKTRARYHVATPDYFRSLGTPLIRGRFFTDSDVVTAPNVIVVNETMANRYWPGDNAIGKRIAFDDHPKEADWYRIVGIVGDVKDQLDNAGAIPALWWPLAQNAGFRQVSVVLRSTLNDRDAIGQLRKAIRQLDPSLAVADARSLGEIADSSVATHRFALFLIALFSVVALVLAAVGMYGVIAYSVSLRMPEFGVRMALGAKSGQLLRLILGQGMKLSLFGAAAGIICGLALTRLMSSLLYEVAPSDPLTLIAVPAVALLTAAIACYVPARRATGADPMKALRSE